MTILLMFGVGYCAGGLIRIVVDALPKVNIMKVKTCLTQ